MATHLVTRSLVSLLSRSLSTLSRSSSSIASSKPTSLSSLLGFHRLRPLSAVVSAEFRRGLSPSLSAARCFATRTTSSSLNDPNPNWSNRPPKETILLDGCDFEHWLVVMEKPEGDPTRDEIIDKYIKTLAMVIGSEEEARMKIYSVSTRCYYAFGALVDEETSYKIKELPGVRWVLPDSYLDVKNKDYGGEPFINGQAVPYDPKYHEEWIRNNARANERNRRNDRPRNFDRSRNFDRRRENMQTQGNPGMQNPPPNAGGMRPNNMGGMAPSTQGGMPPPNMGGMPPNNMGGMPPRNMGGMPPPNMGGMPPQNNMGGVPPQNNMGGVPPQNNMGGVPPQNNMGGVPPQNNMGGMPTHNNMGGAPPQNNFGQMPLQNNMGGMPPPNMGGMPPNNMGGYQPSQGWSNNVPQGVASNSSNFQNQNYPPAGVPGGNTYSS